MYIEDLIDNLVGFSSWMLKGTTTFLKPQDRTLLDSFEGQISRGLGLTEKQRSLSVNILKKYTEQISQYLQKDVAPFLAAPQFKHPPRIIPNSRAISIVEDDKKRKYIRLVFPYDEKLVEGIKALRGEYQKSRVSLGYSYTTDYIRWNENTRNWEFLLTESNVKWICENFPLDNFEVDEDIKNFLAEIKKVEGTMEQYVPMVNFADGKFYFSNSHQNIPQPSSNDILAVLFEAKKYGIFCWDEAIDIALEDKSIGHFTRKVLRENLGRNLPQNGEILTPNDLVDTIKYAGTSLFVIPGGSELDSLKHCIKFLKEFGYTSEEMSVLFRLDSSAGAICNEYVRENKLNNPISDKIKIYFISGKVPKPLIASEFPLDVIINMGNNSAHYTQRNLLKNHHCVINYTVPKENKGY